MTDRALAGQPVADVVLLSGKVASCRERPGHSLPDGPHALYAAPPSSPLQQAVDALERSRPYVEEYACGKPLPDLQAVDAALTALRAHIASK